jgi:site-specific DNA recombinase
VISVIPPAKVAELNAPKTDIEPMLEKAIKLLSELDDIYIKSNTSYKRELIGSIFPEKLEFSGESYRTTRLNEAVKLIYSMGQAFGKIKMGQKEDISRLSQKVNPLVQNSNHLLEDLKLLCDLLAA